MNRPKLYLLAQKQLISVFPLKNESLKMEILYVRGNWILRDTFFYILYLI